MARGRHPHGFARTGGQAVAAALRGAQAPKSPTYEVVYQTDAGNLITEVSRTEQSVTFRRIGIVHPEGDEFFPKSQSWATLNTTEVARLIAVGVWTRIN